MLIRNMYIPLAPNDTNLGFQYNPIVFEMKIDHDPNSSGTHQLLYNQYWPDQLFDIEHYIYAALVSIGTLKYRCRRVPD